MSTQNHEPIHPSTSLSESMLPDSQSNGVSQRSQDITRNNRESRAANGENRETGVSVRIPRSMQEKVRYLGDFMGQSTENLLNIAIQSIISHAKKKREEIPKLEGYPKEKISDSEDSFSHKVELSGKVFEELNRQDLLSDVSECAVLGLKFLYLRLIELDEVG